MRMKSTVLMLLMLVVAGTVLAAGTGDVTLGFHALFGGRYDDVRMCVGSPAGVKGGPIGEAYLDVRIPGIKAFYAPLLSGDYESGMVLGGGVEVHYAR